MNPFLVNLAQQAYQALPGHQGSWGTKDVGLTEKVGSAMGAPRTSQGGSNILGAKTSSANTGTVSGAKSGPGGSYPTGPTSGGGSYSGGGGGGSQPSSGSFAPPSIDPLLQEIENSYGSSMGYLDQAEGALRSQLPSALEQAEKEYQASAQIAGDRRSGSLSQLSDQELQASRRKEDTMAASRRLFGEQRMGGQQRFGGSSSAGQAYSEILGMEQQRQQGQTSRQFNDVVTQIETARQTVEKEYKTGLMQLETQKSQAIQQVQADFQNKLLEIANNRAQLGQAKAQMRLQALQELRNQVFTIEMQNKQFQQTLALQKDQASNYLSSYAQQLTGATNQGAGAVSGFNQMTTTTPTNNLQAGGNGTGQTSTNPLMGMISRDDEQLTGQITPTRRQDPYAMA